MNSYGKAKINYHELIFQVKIDQILIRNGLKPSVWEYKNGYICYLPKRRTIIRSDQAAVPI